MIFLLGKLDSLWVKSLLKPKRRNFKSSIVFLKTSNFTHNSLSISHNSCKYQIPKFQLYNLWAAFIFLKTESNVYHIKKSLNRIFTKLVLPMQRKDSLSWLRFLYSSYTANTIRDISGNKHFGNFYIYIFWMELEKNPEMACIYQLGPW